MSNERSTNKIQTLIALDYMASKMRIVFITDETVIACSVSQAEATRLAHPRPTVVASASSPTAA